MELHNLTSSRPKAKRVGRGGKRGKTSGRGTKGQKARAGHHIRPEVRDVINKLPKLRGYRFNRIGETAEVVNLSDIEKAYSAGETVSPDTLLAHGLVRRSGGSLPTVKILGDGELTKKVTVANCKLSKSAAEKITALGGSVAQ